MESIASAIARLALELYKQTPPEAALDKAKLALLDMLGVTLAGSRHPGIKSLHQAVSASAAPGPVSVYGHDLRLNALDAALINGTSAHMLDYDDSNSQLHGHPSVAIYPAVLSVAQDIDASGLDVLRAYIVGFEAAVRIGLGVSRFQYTHGWHPTSSVGIFAGVVGAGVLAGLTQDQLTTALAIATSMASGIKANFGSMTKPLHVGHAARNALFAIRLAHNGFTGRAHAFEHEAGYLNVFDRAPENYNAEIIVKDWGQPHALLAYPFRQKQFPCCYAILPAATAVLELISKHGIRIDTVRAMHVGVHPIRFPHINNPHPKNALEAKFSLHFCLARLLSSGTLTNDDFESDLESDAKTTAFMSRITLSTFDKDNIYGAVVRAELEDGATVEFYAQTALGGSYEKPLPPDMVRRKFEDCASVVLPESQVAEVYQRLLGFEGERRAADLLTRLQASASH